MPRTPEQFEKIREGKRRQIMETALRLFAREGFHNTSISMIAREAGISKGLMYNYFESKEALISVIIEEGIQEMLAIFDPDKDGVLTSHEFEYFVGKSFDVLTANTTYWKLYFSILMQPGMYEMVKNKYEHVITESMQIITDYYRRKGLKNPETEAILFGAVMDGISMNYLLSPDLFPLEEMKKIIIERFR